MLKTKEEKLKKGNKLNYENFSETIKLTGYKHSGKLKGEVSV